jgi:hypothetical protein
MLTYCAGWTTPSHPPHPSRRFRRQMEPPSTLWVWALCTLVRSLTCRRTLSRIRSSPPTYLGWPHSATETARSSSPRTLRVYHDPGHVLVLSGHRPTDQSLWIVDLHPHMPDANAPSHTACGGMHIAANCISQQDASSYVRFIHRHWDIPAQPRSCKRCVSAGYITGPRQFPRLTTKMVRRHMPNALATARMRSPRQGKGSSAP